ncbi:TerB family tellurite resistance protein [Bacteriovorax sp. Seq25_V]|uniref:tellurite resistance TerB family protein n=1 Tax=Bacteriovorax sp. Seq25_V TaxID=1201288 RepID=UPI000389DCF2|nr:TerB family tellurite resistance protein [Bacteriovorax sp. Seq25_V]EQC47413.1 hypothetical protein M900_0744 [Bacteriovorax sp. Seq25_V]
MNKSEVKLLLCHYFISNSHYDLIEAEKFLNYFNFSYQMQMSKFEKDVKLVEVKRITMKLPESELRLAKLYFNSDELYSVYELVFKYFFTTKRNGKTIDILQNVERVWDLCPRKCFSIRYKFFEKLYVKDISLHDYSRAVLSYFMISFGNDGILDDQELSHFRSLLHATKYRPKMPIEFFEFNNVLDLISIEREEAMKIRETLLGAANSDGSYHVSEIKYIKEIIDRLGQKKKHRKLNIDLLPFLTLDVLMSDGKLTAGEKKWFTTRFKQVPVAESINEYFLIFALVSKNLAIYKENKDFFRRLMPRGAAYTLAAKLYVLFMNRYMKLSELDLHYFAKQVFGESDIEILDFAMGLNREQIRSEEVFMLMNFITNEHIDTRMLNGYLDVGYIKSIYQKLSANKSLLEYYFICKSLFVDRKLSAREYELLWSAFVELDIDFTILEQAISDYSLLYVQNYSIDKYFEYLKEGEVI